MQQARQSHRRLLIWSQRMSQCPEALPKWLRTPNWANKQRSGWTRMKMLPMLMMLRWVALTMRRVRSRKSLLIQLTSVMLTTRTPMTDSAQPTFATA